MSQKIITLPKQLANQIAAGEVVERPVSVVKELLENSLDAGADHIEIELINGWIDEITIRDNGLGIPWEYLVKALEKYSTSKITSLDDLYKVMTFGFRWEALASISSVSEFSMSSKVQDSKQGNMIHTKWGDSIEQSVVAHEVGTTVKVDKLFFNTPARLAYLKKPRTEYLKTLYLVQKIALAYPEVWFHLSHDDKSVLKYPQNQSLEQRAHEIFGEQFAENIRKVSHEFSGIKIYWYITNPSISFKNKTRQVLFVNKRVISSPMIAKAIHDAYNRFIPHGTYPWYILSLEVDPTRVDVNVHPRKMEVRFAEESSIFRCVFHGVKDELERVSLVSTATDHTSPRREDIQEARTHESLWNTSQSYYTGSGTKFKNYSPYKNTQSNPSQASIDFSKQILWNSHNDLWVKHETIKSGDIRDTPLGRIVWQIHNSYIVVETIEWMQLLDQHALAERVIYEKLAANSYISHTQWLLSPIWLHLAAKEVELLENHISDFKNMWFDIEILSGGNTMIHGIPDFVSRQNIEKVFQNILEDISHVWSIGLEEVRHKIWAFTACRSAVKFGDPLSIFEINALLYDAALDYSATCPHGRPVVYNISLEELLWKYER